VSRITTATPASRPLRLLSEEALAQHFEAALAAADGVTGAHCVHEWWMRGAFPTTVESAQARLWRHAAASVPDWLPMSYVHWLPKLYDVAAGFRATTKGRTHLYLVLLDMADRRGDDRGLYVGMSRYPAAQRFDQHKAGIRAAGSVLKRGIEVLTGPVMHLQRMSRAEAERLEAALAAALADAGFKVEGGH
jgi:hypothetical protein